MLFVLSRRSSSFGSLASFGLIGLGLGLVIVGCGGAEANPVRGPAASQASSAPHVPVGGGEGPPVGVPAGAPGSSAALSHPASAEVQRGLRALDAGDLGQAKEAFAAAEAKDPTDADAAYFSGVIADRAHDTKTAEADFRRALSLSPGHAAASADLSALETEDGRDEEAASLCRAALRKHPQNSVLHLNLAVALAKTNDASGAASEFEAAVKADSQQPMYFLTYGHWLTVWQKPEAARRTLTAARALAQGDVAMLAGVAHEMLELRDFSDCVSTLGEAIRLQDAGELRMERAFCQDGAGDEAGARADLEAAVKNDPSFAPAHFILASHLAKAGDAARAIGEYETYAKLAPDTPNAKVAWERVRLLQKAHGPKALGPGAVRR